MNFRNKRGMTLIEVLIIILVIVTLGSMVLFGGGRGCMNMSSGTGQKVGQVVKFSNQGLFVSTWEGQLIRGGLSDGSGSIGTQTFDFTVEDEELIKKVQQFMEEQTEVVIDYEIEGLYLPTRSESSGNFLIDVKPAKKPAAKK